MVPSTLALTFAVRHRHPLGDEAAPTYLGPLPSPTYHHCPPLHLPRSDPLLIPHCFSPIFLPTVKLTANLREHFVHRWCPGLLGASHPPRTPEAKVSLCLQCSVLCWGAHVFNMWQSCLGIFLTGTGAMHDATAPQHHPLCAKRYDRFFAAPRCRSRHLCCGLRAAAPPLIAPLLPPSSAAAARQRRR